MSEDVEKLLSNHTSELSKLAKLPSSDVLDPVAWAEESFKMAPSAYDGAIQHEKLPDEYLKKNLDGLQLLLIKGGYRLAHLLTYVFDETVTTTSTTLETRKPTSKQVSLTLGTEAAAHQLEFLQ